MILPEQKLDALVTRLKTVEAELAAGPERDTYVRLSREFAELQPLVATITAYRATEGEIADLDAMLADAATDADMRALAESEKPALEEKRAALAWWDTKLKAILKGRSTKVLPFAKTGSA